MNIVFRSNHQTTTLKESKKLLDKSHKNILFLIEKLNNEELFTKKYYIWTGSTSLGSYIISSTSSHYNRATKKIRAHMRNIKKE